MERPFPRVGISRCLLGDRVRYDGTHRRDDRLLGIFDSEVEWVPVCPEAEVGMGTPREPIELVAAADGVQSRDMRVRLVGVDSGADWTDRMRAWAVDRVRELNALNLAGCILKARSPSCGITGVLVRGVTRETRAGRGLFAQALIEAMPDLPIADEEELTDPRLRAAFVARVRARHAQHDSHSHPTPNPP